MENTIPFMKESWSILPDIALFVAVARAGHFGRAAERLEMPASTLSRRIAAMEKRLGVTLFQRTTRSLALTPLAQAYLARCEKVLEAAEQARDTLDAGREQPARLRIAMPVDLGVEVLGPLIAAYLADRPALRVEFALSSSASDLFRDPVDLAFRIGRALDDRVVARRVGVIASGLYAAPAFLRTVAPLERASQLPAVPCLELRTAQGAMAWSVGGHRWPQAPGPCAMAANSVGLLRVLAEQGHGVALLPRHLAAPSLASGQLEPVLPGEATPAWPLYAVTASRTVPRAVAQLVAHVRQSLTRHPL
jgi:DNA-binding transcriptional LysR family regulator